MKRLDLDPTDENIRLAILNDSLGRNKHIKTFYELLQNCEGINAIAIDGEWGSGKTFFAKELCEVINCHKISTSREEIVKKLSIGNLDESMIAVYYDAWKNDDDFDPIISILCEISLQLDDKFKIGKNIDIKGLISAIARLIPICGDSVEAIIGSTESNDIVEKFNERKKLKIEIQNYFAQLLEEKTNKLIIFIDELDRCNPIFAIKLLERIKHYLNNDNIIFVFTINSTQLQYSVKKCYGYGFDGYGYLDRFFDIGINIPTVDQDKIYETFCIYYSNSDNVIKTVVHHYNMQIRDISHYKFLCNVIAGKFNKNQGYLYPSDQNKMFLCTCIAPLIIGIFLNNKEDYNTIISGSNVKLFVDFFIETNMYDDVWARLGLTNQEQEDKENCAKEVYEAIFGKYDNQYVDKSVGRYQFSNKSKQEINEITSLLSNMSYFM